MIKRVLVGVDFSGASHQALERGGAWAARLAVPLVAMHILQPPAPMLPEAQIALPDPAWLKSMEDHAREQLQNWLKPFPGSQALVKWGGPAEELVSEADPDTLLPPATPLPVIVNDPAAEYACVTLPHPPEIWQIAE